MPQAPSQSEADARATSARREKEDVVIENLGVGKASARLLQSAPSFYPGCRADSGDSYTRKDAREVE